MSPCYIICVCVAAMFASAIGAPEPTFSKPEIKIIHHHPIHIPHYVHSRHLHVEPIFLHPPHHHHHHHHHEEIILAEPPHDHEHIHHDIHDHHWH